MTFTHLFSVHNTFYLINSSQDLELKTLDYKFKVTNFLQVLFCERYVCLKIIKYLISKMTFTLLFSVHNFYSINSSQDIELKTLDYKSKVVNFLQVLFCERYVCLKVNFIIQQNIYFVSDMIFLKMYSSR